ncbi:snf2 family helicase [Grosmannia clavigera kw1407]|uniref:Snf2 family helicase n=1 Tax=Grosmannia clavigera (strain kw1407 / UAMH 11150) TaxID=655863 RepID=F0XE06_GROCL|nr:snf2 family helicase [Grosmannia clavigera kw1407]EFX04749.1 snf2 family helicase [Grosmannia clavigera kw1407]
MAASPIQIYAELLPNIRQVSVSVTLPSAVDASTVTEVLPDGVTLRIRHGNLVQELRLPGPVVAAGSRLAIPQPKSQDGLKYASWRLPLVGRALNGHNAAASAAAVNDLAPWSARDLRTGMPVACRSCRSAVVAGENIGVWKDLPSDNWAEMMEFWHCHKPDHQPANGSSNGSGDAHEHGKATNKDLEARGYGANSTISAQAGVGFVDLIALVFAESDCGGIVYSESTFEKGSSDRKSIEIEPAHGKSLFQSLNIFCASCRVQIGYFNFRMLSVTLFKWQVHCDTEATLQPALSECLAATLMATISRSGSSKSLIMPIYDMLPLAGLTSEERAFAAQTLYVWVLNSNIRAEADAILEKLNSDVQEINLPEGSIQAIIGELEDSNTSVRPVGVTALRGMADAVRLDKYIPAGCLVLSANGLTAQDRSIWDAAMSGNTWKLVAHPGSIPPEPGPCLKIPQRMLFLDLEPWIPLMEPISNRWIWVSFKASEDSADHIICRVYVLPNDVYRRLVSRSGLHLRKYLVALMNELDYSPGTWSGQWRSDHSATTLAQGPDAGSVVDDDMEMTLLQMFNSISSPKPQPDLIGDGVNQHVMDSLVTSKIRGLKSKLYGYQSRSAAVMLQRELCPGRTIDPRLLQMRDQHGQTWFYDDVTGDVLRNPRYYDNVSGGILAEEMGTGKTLICLSLILATRAFPAEMPELSRGNIDGSGGTGVRRPKIGSLADMAAAVIAKQSVPWKFYLEETDDSVPEHYQNCIDVIKRNPAHYMPDHFKFGRDACRIPRRSTLPPPMPELVYLSSCSLVIVPANLVRQWQQEIDKHTEGLKVLVVSGKVPVPDVADILEADILLFSIPRFEKLERDRRVTGNGVVFKSPLASVHFKRVIVDEGHRLGNSRMGAKSNVLLVLELLQASARWIVTGTPSTGLFGVDDTMPGTPSSKTNETEETVKKAEMAGSNKLGASSHQQERKDLERIGAMASLYLKVRPWANSANERGDTPADWAIYVMQPKHSSRSSGRKNCLRSTLDSLIIRHRKSEVGDLLPPVVEKIVLLDGSYQDRLCLNLFSMMIVFNAVQSQRADQDYLFHPRQRSALLQLVNNTRQSTFFGGYFYSTTEIARAVQTAEKFLADSKVAISAKDEKMLREAIAFGLMAKDNKFKRLVDEFHEVPVYVRDFPGVDQAGGQLADAWSIDAGDDEAAKNETEGSESTRMTCTAAPLIRALQQFLRPCIDAPHSLEVMFKDGRFVRKGQEVRERIRVQRAEARQGQQAEDQQNHQDSRSRSRTKVTPKLAGDTGLGDDGGNSLKRRGGLITPSVPEMDPKMSNAISTPMIAEIAEPLARAQIVSTASAKLSYLLDAIVRHQETEQIIVFYDSENVAFYLAEHLEMLQVHHLIYARGITAERRAQYVETFNGNARFRVLLMDLSQAAFGLDMRSASRIYFIGPVLNPQVEAQAIGRVRRISQQRQVSVETLVLRDSVEELIVERRRSMTQAEHRTMKTILDDRPIFEWILHAGFGRVEDPDEGLVGVTKSNAAAASKSTPTEKRELPIDEKTEPERPPAKKKARLSGVQVRFVNSPE